MKLRSIRWAVAVLPLLAAKAPAQDVSIAFSEIESRLKISIEQDHEATDLTWLAEQTGLDFLRSVRIREAKLSVDTASKLLTVSGTAKVLSIEASVLLAAMEREGKTLLGLGVQIGALRLGDLMPKLEGTSLQKASLSGCVILMGHARLAIPKDKAPASMAKFFGEREVRFVRGTAFHGTLDPRAIPSLPEALSALGMKADKLPVHGSIEARTDGGLTFEAELPAGTPSGYPSWLKCKRRVLEITSAPEIRIRDTVECTLERETRTLNLACAVGGKELTMSGRMEGAWEKPFGVSWLTLREPGLEMRVSADGTASALLSGVFDLGPKAVKTSVAIEGSGKSLVATFRAEVEGKLTLKDLADFAQSRLGRPLWDGPLPAGLPELEGVHVSFRAGADLSLTVGGKARVLGHEAEMLYTVAVDAEGKPASLMAFNLKDWMPSASFGGGGGGGGGGSKGSGGSALEGLKFPSSLFTLGGRKMKIPSANLSLDARAFFARGFGFGGGGGGAKDDDSGKGGAGSGGGLSFPDFDLDLDVGLSFSGRIPALSLPKGGGLGKLLAAMGWSGGGGGGGGGSGGTGGGGLQFSGSGIDLKALLASPGKDAFKDLSLKATLPAGRPKFYPEWLRSTGMTIEVTGEPSLRVVDKVEVTLDGKEPRLFDIAVSLDGEQLALSGRMAGDWEKPFGVTWLTLREPGLSLSVAADGKTTAGLSGVFDLGAKSVKTSVTVEGTGQSMVASFRAELEGKLTFSDLADFAEKRLGRKLFDGPLPAGLPELEGVHVSFKAGDDLSLTVGGTARVLGHEAEALYTVVIDAEGKPASLVGFNLKDWMPSLSMGGGGGASGSGGKGSSGLEGFKFPSSLFMFGGGRKMKVPSSGLSLDARAFFARGFGWGGGGTGDDDNSKGGGGGAGLSLPDFDLDLDVGLSFSGRIPALSLPKGGGLGKLLAAMGWSGGGGGGGGGSGGTGGGGLQFSGSGIDLKALLASPGKDAFKDLSLKATLPAGRPKFYPEWLRSTGMTIEVTGEPSLKVLDRVEVTLDGKEPRLFDIAVSLDGEQLALSGRMEGDWEKPFGVTWLTLREPGLAMTVSADGKGSATLSGVFDLGPKAVKTSVAIEGSGKSLVATFRAEVEGKLTLKDLADFAQSRLGRPLWDGPLPAGLPELEGVHVSFRAGADLSLTVGGKARVLGHEAEMLYTVAVDAEGKPASLMAFNLKDWMPSASFGGGGGGGGSKGSGGSALEGLKFPSSLFTLGGRKMKIPSANLSLDARAFFARAFGGGGGSDGEHGQGTPGKGSGLSLPDFDLDLDVGLSFSGRIPALSLPKGGGLGKLLAAMGWSGGGGGGGGGSGGTGGGGLQFSGSGIDIAALLSGPSKDAFKDLSLKATLPAGRPKFYPEWLRSTGMTIEVTGEPSLKVVDKVEVTLAGAKPRVLDLALRMDGEQLAMSGRMEGDWEKPLGIKWLTLKEPQVNMTVGRSGDAKAGFDGWLAIAGKKVTVAMEIRTVDKKPQASFLGTVDSLSVGDLAGFLREHAGLGFLKDLGLGNAAKLSNVTLAITHAEHTSLGISATVRIGTADADIGFWLKEQKGDLEPLLVIRRHAGRLSDLLPALKGKPADLEFPEAVWILSPPKAKGSPRVLSSASLEPAARKILSGVYGTGEFEVELNPGIQFGATVPVGKLPQALVKALGIQDPNSALKLEGSLAMSLDLGSGRPSADVRFLELRAQLPRVAAATARLPEGVPAWMRIDASSQRTLALRYEAPSSVVFLMTNDVLADLDGATRHFRLETEVEADAKKTAASLRGRMVGEWKQPFGLKALTLRDVTLSVGGEAQKGAAGGRSGAVSLEGGFDLGPKTGKMRLEILSASGKSLSGSFSGSLDSLSIDDLPKVDLFPELPKAGLDRLRTLLGSLPALEEPTFRIDLGGGHASLTLTAHIDIRGVRANLLAFVAKGESRPQVVFAVRPEKFSLAKLFPALGDNPIVAPLANLQLDNFGLILAAGDQKLEASAVPPEVKDFFVKLTGDEAFTLDLVAGLNLEALLPSKMLPAEMAQVLDRLSQTMGQDKPPGLRLRGAIGASLKDIRLAAALPPIRPANAPKWIKSGQLAIAVTGTPSLMLQAALTVDADGDLLDLMVEGGVERQGASVAISLKSALQADAAWTSPFGIEWLEIRRFSGQLSIDATGSVGLGGGGDVTIGSKDINVFAWTKINASGVPLGLVIKGKSKAGFGLADLADLQAAISRAGGDRGAKLLPLNLLPDISLRDIDLLIASRAVPEEGIDSPGFKVKGDLYIPLRPGAQGTKFLSVDCGVSKEGIHAKGSLAAYSIGPLTWKDATVDIELSRAAQHFKVHGDIELLGAHSKTDLELSREGLAFAVTREIQGLGSVQVQVDSKFDLKKPTFHARATLSNEFADTFAKSAIGETLDVVGKAAAIAAKALEALDAARKGVETVREAAGLPTAVEVIESVAVKRVENAQAAADEHKKDMDRLWKEWQDTPEAEPVKRKARELRWGASKMAYDQGPLSKIAVLNRRKDQLEQVRSKLRAFEEAKAASQKVQAALGDTLRRIAAHKGPTIVVKSMSIEANLDGLQALLTGVPVDLEAEVLFCGKPTKLTINWVVGKPVQNVKRLLQGLMPSVCNLVDGK